MSQICKTVFLVALFTPVIVHRGVLAQQPAAASGSQVQPELARLIRAFSGIWALQLSTPKGPAGSGTEVWRVGPGGNSLIEEYHSTGGEGEINGLGVAWWDKSAGRFQVLWCDNGEPAGCGTIKHGAGWEGGDVVALHEWEEGGKKLTLREVFSGFSENSFTQTLYQGESGGELKRILTITATRKKVP
jgi:hypothetical protein